MSTISVRESISKVIENPWRFVRLRSLAMCLKLFQMPISLKDIIKKCNQPGFIPRTAFLEIDMMQGTAFPPDEHLFENRLHTLQDIFLQAGIVLDIRLDENNVPDLSGPDGTYTDAELDNLVLAHRNPNFRATLNKMSAYLIVATQNDRHDLGVLINTRLRLGCAVFHNEALINTDDLAFLRTTAHEVGHQFNLHHEDGATYNENGITKLSIMNQTRVIQDSSSGWPNGVGLTFRENERKHLSSHQKRYVEPAVFGAVFYKCNAEHEFWHDNIINE